MDRNREGHLSWCKERAEVYLKKGDIRGAWTSFTSDMSKHDETRNHAALSILTGLYCNGHLSSAAEMRKFINEFN